MREASSACCHLDERTSLTPLLLHTPSTPPPGDSAYIIQAAEDAAGGASCSGGGDEAWSPPGGWGAAVEGEAVGIITIEDVIEEVRGRRGAASALGAKSLDS